MSAPNGETSSETSQEECLMLPAREQELSRGWLTPCSRVTGEETGSEKLPHLPEASQPIRPGWNLNCLLLNPRLLSSLHPSTPTWPHRGRSAVLTAAHLLWPGQNTGRRYLAVERTQAFWPPPDLLCDPRNISALFWLVVCSPGALPVLRCGCSVMSTASISGRSWPA